MFVNYVDSKVRSEHVQIRDIYTRRTNRDNTAGNPPLWRDRMTCVNPSTESPSMVPKAPDWPAALVRDVMTTQVISVVESALIDAAIDLIVSKGISGVPVVDESGRVVGVISEYDVLPLYADEHNNKRTLQPCFRFMNRKLRTIQADATVASAAAVLKASRIRRLLVLDGDDLVGVLSRRDVIRVIRQIRARWT